jgi:putative aminopeptidase FrvX
MPVPDVLRSLLTAPGPSGYEREAARVFAEAAGSFASSVATDTMGSTVAWVDGTSDGLLTAVVGHIDEIGLLVSHIDEKGFLWFVGVGGWDPVILVGQRLEILTAGGRIPGVVGKKPIHLLEPDDRKQAPELKQLHIDIGARDADEAKSMVRIGDVAVIAGEPVEFPNDRVVSRSMDNRLGAYVAYEVARLVASEDGRAPGDVAAVAAVQEEINLAGAATTAFSLEPDVAIVVDVTFETTQPGVDPKTLGEAAFGSGPAIGRGSTLHPLVFDRLVEAAEAASIPYTISPSARYTGTDADAIHLARAGIPTGVGSIPLRHMHSPVEMVQLDDVANVAKLIAAFARRLEPGTSFVR